MRLTRQNCSEAFSLFRVAPMQSHKGHSLHSQLIRNGWELSTYFNSQNLNDCQTRPGDQMLSWLSSLERPELTDVRRWEDSVMQQHCRQSIRSDLPAHCSQAGWSTSSLLSGHTPLYLPSTTRALQTNYIIILAFLDELHNFKHLMATI